LKDPEFARDHSATVEDSPGTPFDGLMNRQFVALLVTDSEEYAVEQFRKYDRTVLPVLDRRGVLLGVVTVDELIDAVRATLDGCRSRCEIDGVICSTDELASRYETYAKRVFVCLEPSFEICELSLANVELLGLGGRLPHRAPGVQFAVRHVQMQAPGLDIEGVIAFTESSTVQ
jgi:hypothetical protein